MVTVTVSMVLCGLVIVTTALPAADGGECGIGFVGIFGTTLFDFYELGVVVATCQPLESPVKT
jgi:hypothetical protein